MNWPLKPSLGVSTSLLFPFHPFSNILRFPTALPTAHWLSCSSSEAAIMFPPISLSTGSYPRLLCLSPHNRVVCSPPSIQASAGMAVTSTVSPYLPTLTSLVLFAFSGLLLFRALTTKVFVYLHAYHLFSQSSSSRAGL